MSLVTVSPISELQHLIERGRAARLQYLHARRVRLSEAFPLRPSRGLDPHQCDLVYAWQFHRLP
jgi:hypothetical protein